MEQMELQTTPSNPEDGDGVMIRRVLNVLARGEYTDEEIYIIINQENGAPLNVATQKYSGDLSCSLEDIQLARISLEKIGLIRLSRSRGDSCRLWALDWDNYLVWRTGGEVLSVPKDPAMPSASKLDEALSFIGEAVSVHALGTTDGKLPDSVSRTLEWLKWRNAKRLSEWERRKIERSMKKKAKQAPA